MKTLKQQLQEFGYDEIGVGLWLAFARKWLEQKRQEEHATYEYLETKAKQDLIHRSMWLSQGAVLDFIEKLLRELKDNTAIKSEGDKTK